MNLAIVYNQPEPDRYQAMGESSAELGVLDEVKAVQVALKELRWPSFLVPLRPPLDAARETLAGLKQRGVNVIFNLFEGFGGAPETEAQVAETLAGTGIPYTGSPPAALALALDKSRAKRVLEKEAIRTPASQVLTPRTISRFRLWFPVIVKPLAEDASHGISEASVVNDRSALEEQVEKTSRLFGGQALVEQFIGGREFNTTVIGNRRLSIPAVSEIVYALPPDKPRILTFEAKWDEQSPYYTGTQPICPAAISRREAKMFSDIARTAFRSLGCRGYGRIDFRQGEDGSVYVLEVNPNPDIGPASGAARQAACAGLPYSQFIKKIITLAKSQ